MECDLGLGTLRADCRTGVGFIENGKKVRKALIDFGGVDGLNPDTAFGPVFFANADEADGRRKPSRPLLRSERILNSRALNTRTEKQNENNSFGRLVDICVGGDLGLLERYSGPVLGGPNSR